MGGKLQKNFQGWEPERGEPKFCRPSKGGTNPTRHYEKEMNQSKNDAFRAEYEAIAETMNEKGKRLLLAAQEKGASSWLSALPLRKRGYVLNKQEFRDALCLRYGWQIPNTPVHCGCGSDNSLDHILTCKKGGYVTLRHNVLRNTEARLLERVCHDVRVEPGLIPTAEELVAGTAADGARLDVSARGVWNHYEKSFFDIKVTHPNAPSHLGKSLERLYKESENEKKRKYNDRIVNIERASFTPLVFTTSGGMGKECHRFNKRLAEMIAVKQKQPYAHVMADIRTRLRFALLKATVVAVRGFRGYAAQTFGPDHVELDIPFELIPQEPAYEAY